MINFYVIIIYLTPCADINSILWYYKTYFKQTIAFFHGNLIYNQATIYL